ncbi:HxlR family transcriptional regulator [Williamsia limnetica]|uniref:HxlR family transcriptional regulator n=1 Tax=Williamsia limnetica TaxID=882452 RepID=A0A318RMB1_WILLI|nr:helix-turn-helix domain-containing protein [Williamsia limnetica]PYE16866.1 HxlR family transcriptional regulator [Williamsia limnetica]
MALGTDYDTQDCSLARALEIVGERWTMLILRECFFGVRRFTDFQQRLDISKAVLTQRLSDLIDAGVLERAPRGGRTDYVLTEAGLQLWPSLHALIRWGDGRSDPTRRRRIFSHSVCGTDIDEYGRCPRCAAVPGAPELLVRPGPGLGPATRTDPISMALRSERPLLTPF